MTPEEPIVLWQNGPVERTEYRIGCSSWLDTSLLESGLFYPDRRMTSEERLQWYARCFDCVEVNATYYALPSLRTSQLWAERTPPGFEFAIKAYGLMTGHNPKADRLPKLLRELLPQPLPVDQRGETERKHFPQEAYDLCFEMFHDALTPLAQAGKLSYVLFQFAPWIGWTEKTQEYLASLPAKLPGWRIAVEGRNPSWFKRVDEVLKFLADHGLIHVAIDCPWAPLIPAATSDWAVFRFHGRNVAGWEAQKRGLQPTVAEKYEYLYTPEELGGLADAVQKMHRRVRRVYTKFNNNFRDYPMVNALQFRKQLGQEAPDPEAMKATWQPSRRLPRPRARPADDDLGLFR